MVKKRAVKGSLRMDGGGTDFDKMDLYGKLFRKQGFV